MLDLKLSTKSNIKEIISELNDIRMGLDCDPNIKDNCYDKNLNIIIEKLKTMEI